MSSGLIVVMFVHILWTATLYAFLTVARAPKIWNIGLKADGSNPWEAIEPRVSANLSNQFEWPVFFHAICLIIIAHPELVKSVYLWLGSLFLVGRIIHSAVQILTTNTRLRGIVFTINFLSVLAMWGVLIVSLLL